MYYKTPDKLKPKRLLTRKEEVKLAKLKDKGNISARNRLVEHNLRLVLSIARKYKRYGVDFDDIVSEGNMGLMKGIDKFDWKRGFKISTYVSWWITQSIAKFVMENSEAIKTPTHICDLNKKIKRMVDEYNKKFRQNPTVSEIAYILDINEKAVSQAVTANGMSFIPITSDRNSEDHDLLESSLKCDKAELAFENFDKKEIVEIINDTIEKLPEVERIIFNLRHGVIK